MLPLQTRYTTIDLLSQLVTQIRGAASFGFTDLNRVAEDLLVPVLKLVYGCEHLENLNRASLNYPAVDLGDRVARVAFQVTSTPTADKVAHTLTKFVEARLFTEFDRLVIFILGDKQKSYPESRLQKIVAGSFAFDLRQDIQDYRDLAAAISALDLAQQRAVNDVLASYLAHGEPLVHGAPPRVLSPKRHDFYRHIPLPPNYVERSQLLAEVRGVRDMKKTG